MAGYTDIYAMLDQLDANERQRHEHKVQKARLVPLLSKGFLFAQAGCPQIAIKYQHRAMQIIKRLS